MGLTGQSMGISNTNRKLRYVGQLQQFCLVRTTLGVVASDRTQKENMELCLHKVSIGLCCIFRSPAQSDGHIKSARCRNSLA